LILPNPYQLNRELKPDPQKKIFLETPRPTTTSSKKDLPGNTTTNHNQPAAEPISLDNIRSTTNQQRNHRPNPEPNHRQTPKHLTTHLQKFSLKPL
jgi:hypothetical protein